MTGDVVVFGGNVSASGTVEGNVVAVGGNLNLAESAVVQGDVASIGGNLDQVIGALVEGKVITEIENPIILSTVRDIRLPAYRMMGFQGVLGVAWFFLKIFLWAILAAVVVLFLPKHTERTAQAVADQPILSGGIGLSERSDPAARTDHPEHYDLLAAGHSGSARPCGDHLGVSD